MVSWTSIKHSCIKLPETEQERQVLAGFWCVEYIHTAFSVVTLCTCSFIVHCFGRLFLSNYFFWTLNLHLGLLKEKRGTRHGALSRSRSNPQKENSKTDSCAFLHWAQWVHQYPSSPAAIWGAPWADRLFIGTCLHKANIYLSALSKFAIHLCCYPAGFLVNSRIFQKEIL